MLHLLFAWRYFKAKKSTHVINIIAWICIVAIIIGTAALLLVLSVFNGFEGLVKSLYASFYPDIRMVPAAGKVMTLSQQQLAQLRSIQGINNFSLVVEEKAILQNTDNQKLIYLKGVDSNYSRTTAVSNHIIRGIYDVGTATRPKLIIGAGIESALGTLAGVQNEYPLTIYIPRKSASEHLDESSNISSDTLHAAGSFVIQQDFDDKYAITDIDFVKAAIQLNADEYSAVEISVRDSTKIDVVKAAIEKVFSKAYKVQNRYQQNQSLYAVMNMERWIFYAVLCLILVVAAFNMIGALTMLVLEKRKDISILNALGANKTFILRVFLAEGFLLAIIGGGIGMLLALVLVLLQLYFHVVPLQGGSFLIDYFPVQLRLFDFLLVGITVAVIALIASFAPAWKASRHTFSLRSE